MKIFMSFILVLLVILTPFISRVFGAMRQGKALLKIHNLIVNDIELLNEIGEIETTGLLSYQINLNSGTAEVDYEIIGEKHTKTFKANALKNNRNEWYIDSIQ